MISLLRTSTTNMLLLSCRTRTHSLDCSMKFGALRSTILRRLLPKRRQVFEALPASVRCCQHTVSSEQKAIPCTFCGRGRRGGRSRREWTSTSVGGRGRRTELVRWVSSWTGGAVRWVALCHPTLSLTCSAPISAKICTPPPPRSLHQVRVRFHIQGGRPDHAWSRRAGWRPRRGRLLRRRPPSRVVRGGMAHLRPRHHRSPSLGATPRAARAGRPDSCVLRGRECRAAA